MKEVTPHGILLPTVTDADINAAIDELQMSDMSASIAAKTISSGHSKLVNEVALLATSATIMQTDGHDDWSHDEYHGSRQQVVYVGASLVWYALERSAQLRHEPEYEHLSMPFVVNMPCLILPPAEPDAINELSETDLDDEDAIQLFSNTQDILSAFFELRFFDRILKDTNDAPESRWDFYQALPGLARLAAIVTISTLDHACLSEEGSQPWLN